MITIIINSIPIWTVHLTPKWLEVNQISSILGYYIRRSLGLAGLFEYVCALSQKRSSKIYHFSFENIWNNPPNQWILWFNRIQMTLINFFSPSDFTYWLTFLGMAMTGRKIVQIERLQAIRDRFRRKLDSKYGGGRRSNITKSKFLITPN